MHSGGSMTGGSVQSRVTSLLSREREIAEHKERMISLEKTVEQLTASLHALEEKRTQLKEQRSALFDEVRQQEIACAREEAHLASAGEALEAQRDRLSRSQSEADRMREQLADVQTELKRLGTQQQGEEKTGADQQAEIVRLNGEITVLREEAAAKRKIVTDERIVQAARERGLTALTSDLNRMTSEHTDLEKERNDSRRALTEVESASPVRSPRPTAVSSPRIPTCSPPSANSWTRRAPPSPIPTGSAPPRSSSFAKVPTRSTACAPTSMALPTGSIRPTCSFPASKPSSSS